MMSSDEKRPSERDLLTGVAKAYDSGIAKLRDRLTGGDTAEESETLEAIQYFEVRRRAVQKKLMALDSVPLVRPS